MIRPAICRVPGYHGGDRLTGHEPLKRVKQVACIFVRFRTATVPLLDLLTLVGKKYDNTIFLKWWFLRPTAFEIPQEHTFAETPH